MIQCVLCQEVYTPEQIAEGLYFLETMVCARCYSRLQDEPQEKSCFGKPTTIFPSGKRVLGYDPEAEECAGWCPDRFLCSRLVGKVRQ